MASETGAKWVMLLVLYFTIFTVIVSLVADISPSVPTTSGGYDLSTNTSGTYCALPRLIYEPWITDAGEKTIRITSSDDLTNDNPRYSQSWVGNVECKYSQGQLGETQCEALSGCTWASGFSWWIFGDDTETCKGQLNYTWINSSDTYNLWGFGEYLTDIDACGYEPVKNNRTNCEIMSCSWGEVTNDIDLFTANDVDLNANMLTKTWSVVKDMVLFRFDFGFDNSTANFILTFILFILPLLGLALAIYVMVRS